MTKPKSKAAETTPESEHYAPATVEQAQAFHRGVLAGLVRYAKAHGHPTDESRNVALRTLAAHSGFECIENFERITGRKI